MCLSVDAGLLLPAGQLAFTGGMQQYRFFQNRQPLVTRKHRKVRRLAERHPDVKVKLLYRRDVERLARKYGLAAAAA